MITARERNVRTITILNRLHEIRAAAKRPLDSRRVVRIIHNKHPEYSVHAVWGIIGYLTRTNVINWVVKNPPKGKSYFV